MVAKFAIEAVRQDTHANAREKPDHGMILILKSYFCALILPEGFPSSVSADYSNYQVWDTAQAFCSSIMGTLATSAVLEGFGVGNATASVVAATYTHLLKNVTGMVAGIWFAWYASTDLDRNAKQWRLVADIFNDAAMCIELMSAAFGNLFVVLNCFASFLRAVVGVAGSATRAALVRHQAICENMADVSAKDGSQETLVNFGALIVGFLITPFTASSQLLSWTLFLILVGVHLYCNYCAVRALEMPTFNHHRLTAFCRLFLCGGDIMSISEANRTEPLLPGDVILKFI
eukprot:gene5324-7095_t